MALEEREEGRGRVRQHCTTELPVSAGNLLSNASLFAPEPAPADELRVRSAPTAPRPVPGWGSHPSDQAPAGSESTSQQEAEFTGAVLQAELRQAQTFVLSLPYAGMPFRKLQLVRPAGERIDGMRPAKANCCSQGALAHLENNGRSSAL
jgi:hypothetical protein